MNWKDYPNLFASGKFKVHSAGCIYLFDGWSYFGQRITGYDVNRKRHNLSKWILPEYENVKLIARPISDMSDKECKKIIMMGKYDVNANGLRKYLPRYEIKQVDIFHYLLSIGVYPLDDTTNVIFKNKEKL